MRPFFTVSLSLTLLWAGPAGAAPWPQFAGNPQHDALSPNASGPLEVVRWTANLDETGQDIGDGTHFGAPVITSGGTVVVPVRLRDPDLVTLEYRAFRLDTGAQVWRLNNGFRLLEPFGLMNAVQAPSGQLIVPGPGGTFFRRASADAAQSTLVQQAFVGLDRYEAAASDYNQFVFMSAPPLVGPDDAVYFPVAVSDMGSSRVGGLTSGLARVAQGGGARYVTAQQLLGEPGVFADNSVPALSRDGKLLYAAVFATAGAARLFALDSATLAVVHQVRLTTPLGTDAVFDPVATSSPMVGPDGDVYYGAARSDGDRRGFLFHFDGALATAKPIGAFGHDVTPTLVPVSLVPSYKGDSTYLILTKFNNYNTGDNHIAVWDPNQTQIDPTDQFTVMREVIDLRSPTPWPFPDPPPAAGAVSGWCVNTTVVDPFTHSALAGNEDGKLYRWDLTTNTITESILLAKAISEPYTPTEIAPDGSVLAINNSVLYVVGRKL
jgi:hypothetical protein